MSASGAVVVLVSGHMVDSPNRKKPRFPPSEVPRVQREVREALQAWGVGSATTVVTGGARGADVLAAEEALARGARLVLCLALPPEEFVRRSVALPGSDWEMRFRRLLAVADVRVLPHNYGDVGKLDVFMRANAWMAGIATEMDPVPHVLLVWNGHKGDGPGGTSHMAGLLGLERPQDRVHVIDPTPRAYEERQDVERPKRLLALDGGGIRGALSLEILAAVESQLRSFYACKTLVLADYFDYIAGTSTGAIIAAGLALGREVAQLQRCYESLGRAVFSKRLLPMRLRSLYRDGPLRRELEQFYGAGRTLGDPELRSLLLMVLHNSVTDSPWVLSNCTRAKYNRPDRYLLRVPDRNLDIPLVPLVRASTAAPFFFLPEEVRVGEHRFVFQDGGVTPYNNPAFLLFLVATLPEYGLAWPVGEEQLLLVSVGTGAAEAVHPGLTRSRVGLWSVPSLPAVFMNGASVAGDMHARSFGTCRSGPVIDREFGDRIRAKSVAGRSLFTYMRIDADLSDEALVNAGVTRRRHRSRVRKLDAVDQLDMLRRLGAGAGAAVHVPTDFAGFL